MTADYWKKKLNLQSHPEGGSYARVYISPLASAIYFLLDRQEFSAIHTLKQDELWHFYDGSTLLIHIIEPTGKYRRVQLGRNPEIGEAPMGVVPAGCFFGAEVVDKNSFALVGCTLSPPFDFKDFNMPSREYLLKQFPQHGRLITKLTRTEQDQ